MASELRVNTLKDAAGNNSIATSFVAGGSAKAWVNFNGNSTPSISGSFNVASLTDNAVGRYSANYVNSMGTSTYATQVCSDADSSNDAFNRIAGGSNTTTSKAYLMHFENGSSSDTSIMIGTINGDLA